jgi:hypothetical protein
MKAVISGGRDVHITKEGEEALYKIFACYDIKTIANGMARGVDSDAYTVAKKAGVDIFEFPAEWDKYGKSAGHRRNRQMLDFIGPGGILIVFDGGNGTKGIEEEALKRNMAVIRLCGEKYGVNIR